MISDMLFARTYKSIENLTAVGKICQMMISYVYELRITESERQNDKKRTVGTFSLRQHCISLSTTSNDGHWTS